MKRQWRKFLKENEGNWSYGIVPQLVERLAEAIEAGDEAMAKATLEALATQGVVLDRNGNLRFAMDIALGN